VDLLAAVRSSSIALLLKLRLFLDTYFFARYWLRAALATAFFGLLLFSYGHIYHGIRQIPSYGITAARHRFMSPVYGVILLVGLVYLDRKRMDLERTTQELNILDVVLVTLPLIRIGQFSVRITSERRVSGVWHETAALLETMEEV
jgi:hypothetical protein